MPWFARRSQCRTSESLQIKSLKDWRQKKRNHIMIELAIQLYFLSFKGCTPDQLPHSSWARKKNLILIRRKASKKEFPLAPINSKLMKKKKQRIQTQKLGLKTNQFHLKLKNPNKSLLRYLRLYRNLHLTLHQDLVVPFQLLLQHNLYSKFQLLVNKKKMKLQKKLHLVL